MRPCCSNTNTNIPAHARSGGLLNCFFAAHSPFSACAFRSRILHLCSSTCAHVLYYQQPLQCSFYLGLSQPLLRSHMVCGIGREWKSESLRCRVGVLMAVSTCCMPCTPGDMLPICNCIRQHPEPCLESWTPLPGPCLHSKHWDICTGGVRHRPCGRQQLQL